LKEANGDRNSIRYRPTEMDGLISTDMSNSYGRRRTRWRKKEIITL